MGLMTFVNCENEKVDLTNENASVVKARDWFEKNKPNLKVLEYAKTINWNKAIITDGVEGKVIEIPIVLKDNVEVKAKNDKNFKTYNRLMFIEKNKNISIYHILISTLNIDFDNENRNFNYYKLNADFKGYITVLNSNNELSEFLDFLSIKTNNTINTSKTKNEGVTTCLYYGYWDQNNEFHPYFEVGCYGGGGGGSVSSGSTSYGSGGGKGTTEPTIGNVEIVIIGPSNVIANLNDYLKCFNLSQGATLIIYVDQPKANTPDSWSGLITDPDVGHTFIAIQQGNIRRVFGYYPRNSVNPYSAPSDPAAFGNDQGHLFDVSLSIPITASQLINVIGYSINAPSTYNLNSYNCTDFGISIGNLAGLNLPDSYGTWPNGGGSNPGQLGQNIRGMILPLNATRQTTNTNSAPNNGVCN